jgi:hypothetical protein
MGSDALLQQSVLINGHPAFAGQLVWSGDLLQSTTGTKVNVALESIGAMRLEGGTAVRLAVRHTSRDARVSGLTLIASLGRGEIFVELDRTANAYLRAAGSEYSCSDGAEFRATIREGRAFLEVKSGAVRAENQGAQHQYTIRPGGHGSNIRVEGGKLTRLQVQVMEDDKPVPGVGVLFALDTSQAIIGLLGMGTLTGTTANVVTDADGMAAVQFVARDSAGSGSISATVEGTRVAWIGEITVTTGRSSHVSPWAYLVVGGAAAAAGIAWAVTRQEDDLKAQPPIVKSP